MTSISEKGHARNVANLENLIAIVTTYGTSYNPSSSSIQLPALQSLLAASADSLHAVNQAYATYSNAVVARKELFDPFSKLVTRISNSLKASGTTDQICRSAQTITRKLQGKRASAKLTDDEKKALEAKGTIVNQISAAQMSYDSRIENFNMLISFLSLVPEYNPNEQELKIESLKELHAAFITKNRDAITACIHLDNARMARNKILYHPTTGLVDVSINVKAYIKSLFGTSSHSYKQISKLEFKSVNKK
jgi:hypothetical protein